MPASLMYFCSGEPKHFCSGVDRRAYCPAFESYEASTGGETREEALTHIHSRLFMILEQILAQRAPVPVDVEVPNGTLISVEI